MADRTTQARNLPEGWAWTDHDDGSGSLRSPDGMRYFSYDRQTGEVLGLDGHWRFDLDAFGERERLEEEMAAALPWIEKAERFARDYPDIQVLHGKDPLNAAGFLPVEKPLCAIDEVFDVGAALKSEAIAPLSEMRGWMRNGQGGYEKPVQRGRLEAWRSANDDAWKYRMVDTDGSIQGAEEGPFPTAEQAMRHAERAFEPVPPAPAQLEEPLYGKQDAGARATSKDTAISSEKSSLATNEKEKSMAKEENVVPAEFAEGAAALSGENTASPTVQAPETAKAEWVNLSVKGAFLREAHDKKGNLFYDVSIPDGTKLGGAIDIGGYHFTASESRVHDSKYDPNGVTIGLVKDRPLQITKGIRQEDGTYRNVSREVRPENLRVALNNQYKDYKVTKAAERAAAKPDQAISQSPQASPAHDQKAAAKSASARAKSPAKAPVKKASH